MEENTNLCPLCHGRGGDLEIECRNCAGTGYDPEDGKPFKQCHTCFGDGVEEVEDCPQCCGTGVIYDNESNDSYLSYEEGSMKEEFESQLKDFVESLEEHISTEDGQWTVKGFIDVFQNIYTISSDTKIVSKILEIHLFPKIMEFAREYGYKIVLAEHQNYYPDISFVKAEDESIKFAVDFKTTYRNPDKPYLCNGFTLGSHGKYFEDRTSTKNIQFPYGEYSGHFCLGIIYDRADGASIDETASHNIKDLHSIASVVSGFQFFVTEKWSIASDKSGSGNTANIGSINNIDDIINGNGMFSKLGESWFDDYWMNYNKIIIKNEKGGTENITSLKDFVKYRKGDISLIVQKHNRAPKEADK